MQPGPTVTHPLTLDGPVVLDGPAVIALRCTVAEVKQRGQSLDGKSDVSENNFKAKKLL
jgi:hypothetical protein